MTLTKSKITDAIRQLAVEYEQVPTKRMWDNWNERPCGIMTVQDRFGGWTEALQAAGLPRSPPVPQTAAVRKALYRKHIEMEGVP